VDFSLSKKAKAIFLKIEKLTVELPDFISRASEVSQKQ